MSSSDQKLADAMAAHLSVESAWVGELLHRCGSPVEQLFLMAVFRQPYTFRVEGYEAFAVDRDGAHWYQQHPVEAGGTTYRLDFAIKFGDTKIAVEIDGHDFHERTKEQARHDKRRDRALTAAGWKVLRFTGSEVFADAVSCGWQVYQVLHPEWAEEAISG